MSMISEQVNSLRGFAEVCRTVSDPITAKYLDGAADTIEELSTKLHNSQMERSSQYYNGGWIPVSERLPELLEDVLMCDSGGDMAIGYYRQGRYVDGREYFEWYSYADDEYDFCPTAWMPLPEPYQSEIPTGAEGSDKE